MKSQAAIRRKSVIEGDDTEGNTHTYCKQKQNVYLAYTLWGCKAWKHVMLTLCGAAATQTSLPPLGTDAAAGLLGHFATAATCREKKRASDGSTCAYMSSASASVTSHAEGSHRTALSTCTASTS